jgi:hypothetical protein
MTLCRIGALAAAMLLAACQPLPHPFADDLPPAALVAVPDNATISIGTFQGSPEATAAKLPAALAHALLARGIPASDQTTSRTSLQLDGRIGEQPAAAGTSVVTAAWTLREPSGALLLDRSDRAAAATADWAAGRDAAVAKLASASAGWLVGRLVGKAPKEVPVSGRARVAVRKVSGAPGDGNTALAASLTALLQHQDVELVDHVKGRPDVEIGCDVRVAPAPGGKQHVTIVWRVARAAGGEVGQVAQENDVPPGRLNGAWGDIAYSVAMAAQGGIMQLVNRAAPGPSSAADTRPTAPPAPGTATPAAAPGVPASPPVPGNIAAPEVNLPPVNVTPDQMPKPLTTHDLPVVLPYRGVPVPHF